MATIPLHIDDPEAYELASDLASRTGRPLADVVIQALRDARQRAVPPSQKTWDQAKIDEILAKARRLTPISIRVRGRRSWTTSTTSRVCSSAHRYFCGCRKS